MLGLTNSASREIDRLMIEKHGLPGLVLMEEAALLLYRFLAGRFNLRNKTILIFAGSGNNGGDGLALARILHNRGIRARLIMAKSVNLSVEAQLQLNVLKNMGIAYEVWSEETDLGCPDIIVDAILGTGFQGELKAPIKEMVAAINMSKGIKVSVDIPTGLNGDNCEGGLYVEADHTIALGYPKWSHLICDNMKSVTLGKLEFDPRLDTLIDETDKLHCLTMREAQLMLPQRKSQSHKGTYGKIGILGGKKQMLGAALMAGKAALKSGCGMATLWLEDIEHALGVVPELMLETWDSFLNKELDVLVIGPGLGTGFSIDLEAILRKFPGTVLIDADGLRLLKEGKIKREWIAGDMILTPHPKEMEMLIGNYTDRREAVKALADRFKAIALIKGHRTLISDGRRVAVNLTGNPGMATAGSGDVLSGIIAGLSGQGLSSYDSTVLGVYLHGLSGDMAASFLGEEALMAGDLTEYLPKAYGRLRNFYQNSDDLQKLY